MVNGKVGITRKLYPGFSNCHLITIKNDNFMARSISK